MAAEPAAAVSEEALDEVVLTGSRIVRRDAESTSPLVTVEKEVLEKSSYISIEQALNELPQFMAGGALNGAGAVTGLTAAGDVMGGAGTGNMFDTARPVDNARAGQYTPGAATVNLRGLGPNRNIVLIDGRRGVPTNASGAIDLNTVPQIAIGNIEVITGGASSVYGADALAGVTNIQLRNNFNGVEVRARGGINEAGGDGKEWQLSNLIGLNIGGQGHAMIAMDYSKREIAYWRNRENFREVMESPYSNAGDYIFQWYPAYAPGAFPVGVTATSACAIAGTGCTTTSLVANAGGGSNNVFNRVFAGNGPTQNAINSVFADRTCVGVNCVGSAVPGIAYYFNADGTLFTPTSQATVAGVTNRYGPQSFTGRLGGTESAPDEVHCIYSTAPGVNVMPGFPSSCNPSLGRVDYGRRLTSPREGFTLLGTAEYDVTDHVSAYSAIMFANSKTETRREPSPTSGNWRVSIPFSANPNQVYLPSVVQSATGGLAVGDTLPEYRVGGKRGTNCAATGGCTMAQAFPVPTELRTLLASRPDVTLNNPNSIYNGRSVCTVHVNQTTDQVDPNTGLPYTICGPNSAWGLANQMTYLPPRGTNNDQTGYQLSAGLKGDELFGIGDWTWDTFVSQGESNTLTDYIGYISAANYAAIMTAPNYGQGYSYSSSISNKTLSCTSGLDPFKQAAGTLNVSADCIAALTSNQADRQGMKQFEAQANFQGGLFDLPAGNVRSAVGFSYRKNTFYFTPDSLREADYVFDGSAGQFGVGAINGDVAVKEVYGELLVPVLKDIPLIKSLELELGFRYSQYTTGQDVPTYKAQVTWQVNDYVRFRGGYNRAERTPNIAELYTVPTTSSQLTTGADPCSTLNGATLPRSNVASNPERAQLQALCLAMINRDGGNNASAWNTNGANQFQPPAPAVVTFRGDPNLNSEQGDTWTAGLVLNSPFSHPLANRITTQIDWYKIKITDPIDVLSSQFVLNACFNQDGSNPTYSLNDPGGYCNNITRDPVTGGVNATNTIYANIGEISVQGVDVNTRWSAALADMGLPSLPGNFSINLNANFLIEQNQPVTVGGALQNYAGYVGASKFNMNTVFGYNWDQSRVNLTWRYRQRTGGLDTTQRPSALISGYPWVSLFNLSAGTGIGPVDVSVNVANIFDTKPKRAGYFLADPYNGFGFFDPNGDLVGRRYALNLTMKF